MRAPFNTWRGYGGMAVKDQMPLGYCAPSEGICGATLPLYRLYAGGSLAGMINGGRGPPLTYGQLGVVDVVVGDAISQRILN